MRNWQSQPIHVNGIELLVHASDEGVTIGKTVDGVYSSDLLLTGDEAMALADAITEAATRLLGGAK